MEEQGEMINFNAGLRTKSIQMRVADYISVENPRIGKFAEDEAPEEEKTE